MHSRRATKPSAATHAAAAPLALSVQLHRRRLPLALLACLSLFALMRWVYESRLPVLSVLHPRTPSLASAWEDCVADSRAARPLSSSLLHITETTTTFPQHGKQASGVHYRLENTQVLARSDAVQDALLVVVVLNDHTSWGTDRTSADFFALLSAFTHPKHQTSLTMLTSSETEFQVLERAMQQHIQDGYAQFSLLYRDDFNMAVHGLSRGNRHDDTVQNERRRMLARYRNFALLSTLAPWHDHVVWLDADVHIVPPTLASKMIASKRDIVEPICLYGEPPATYEYDRNAWVGTRKRPGSLRGQRQGFVPGDLRVKRMHQYRDAPDDFIALDSVGGTMLYVRADVHRQGVVFPHHYIVGGEWDLEGFDGIETEGLCYSAHFLGFKCWGMPHDPIYHKRNS